MKALVFNGIGKTAVEDRPQPTVQDPISGPQGHVPTVEPGRVIGHEGVGVVESVGKDIKKFKVGDRVLIACITSCATCSFYKQGKFRLCNAPTGGWRLGHTHDGTQAEYMRILHADASLHAVPNGVDERSLLVLSDIIPTGLEVGVLRGGVKPGCSVAIVGAGPVGLAALLTTQLHSPSIIVMVDKDEATKEHHGEIDGFDVVIEAVGVPATFTVLTFYVESACQDLVGKGGAIANVGVHGAKVDLRLEELWGRGIQITMALLFEAGKLNTKEMITHDFMFSEMLKAYDTFGKASETGALKVNVEM
ncbi:chaperonin 10-like protein [Cadophora sp. MPI-SDFR-AT-0126]|nr:chaperonin 10-like protein [Leotiomycetes sp. MPI-SDFR-AT-0126]